MGMYGGYSGYSSYGSSLLQIKSTMAIIGAILGLGLAVFLFIMVFPKAKGQKFTNPALRKLHDFLQFNTLILEVYLKGVYTILSCVSITIGLLLLFTGDFWMFFVLTILVPLGSRIIYEVSMLFVLLVANVRDINKKLNYTAKKEEPKAEEISFVSETPVAAAPAATDDEIRIRNTF